MLHDLVGGHGELAYAASLRKQGVLVEGIGHTQLVSTGLVEQAVPGEELPDAGPAFGHRNYVAAGGLAGVRIVS